MYQPLLVKESVINEDIYQELRETLFLCIQKFLI